MTEVRVWRLYLLQAGYLLLVVGLGIEVWPKIIHHRQSLELMHGVVYAMLGAMGALALVGLRHPLKMLPLLFFELAWKSIWLIMFALPLQLAHTIDPDAAETAMECLIAVIFLVLIPWDYVSTHYLRGGWDASRSSRGKIASGPVPSGRRGVAR